MSCSQGVWRCVSVMIMVSVWGRGEVKCYVDEHAGSFKRVWAFTVSKRHTLWV